MREPARQLFVTAVEPRRHRSHRTTQRLCNLLVWQVLEIFQHDRHPQLRLQLRQRRQHGLRNFELRQPLFLKRLLAPILHFDPAAVFIALGAGGGAQEIERDQSSPFPKFIHAFISHHAIKPRFEIRFVTEAGDAREEFQKDLLRHVARRALVAGEAQGDRPHAILVRLEQLTKSLAVPALTGFDQTPLARLFIHYGAPFHKMPEVAPSDSFGRFLWQIPVANPAVTFRSRSLDGAGPGFLPFLDTRLGKLWRRKLFQHKGTKGQRGKEGKNTALWLPLNLCSFVPLCCFSLYRSRY